MNLKLLSLFVFTLIVNTLNAQKEIELSGNLKFGLHEVGVKQLTFVDTLREEPREISISLWYPAKGNTEKVKFADYLDFKNELNNSELLQDISLGVGGKQNLFPTDSLELILNARMKARNRAEAINDPFPLLIWSSRYGTVEYQNILSEYIASHGYVVAFAEDIPNSPYPWQIQSPDDKVKALKQQITDINAAIGYLKQHHEIDKTKIGLLSWSYAGESAILTQMNNQDIDVVVGLSSIGFSSGVYLGKELSTKIDLEKLNVPYLILSEKIGTNGKVKTLPTLFNSMHSNSRYVYFKELAHGNFNGMEGMIPGILRTKKVQSWSNGGEVAQIGYEAICEIIVSFLDSVFHEANFNSFDENASGLKASLPSEFISIHSPNK